MTRPAPTLQHLVPTAIEVRDRLRKVLPRRVEALRPDIRDKGVEQPIEVVETGALPRLVYGAHRLAAVIGEGLPSIPALVYPEGAFGSEHEIRMREISENFFRFELTALERAVNIAEWRIAHEALHPPAKPGPKAKVGNDEAMMELSANFPETVFWSHGPNDDSPCSTSFTIDLSSIWQLEYRVTPGRIGQPGSEPPEPPAPPKQLVYCDQGERNTSAATHTYQDMFIGTPTDTRLVLVCINSYEGSAGASARNINSVIVGGVAATRVIQNTRFVDRFGDNDIWLVSAIYRAVVPAGSAADIVVNFNASMWCSRAFVFAAYNLASHSPYATAQGDNPNVASALSTPSDGVAIASGITEEWNSANHTYSFEGIDNALGDGLETTSPFYRTMWTARGGQKTAGANLPLELETSHPGIGVALTGASFN